MGSGLPTADISSLEDKFYKKNNMRKVFTAEAQKTQRVCINFC
jgi:hypothetical protein